ncbi:hypothetical protein [Bradyrhizobium japonicum]|uniref:hypothetical protein n=1 Tax=Bradyrhizobium japonicum TaxID=375 RepID=UPI00126A57F6|nr:hypothetical protein [Bradyrhizobium japonicum]
MNMIAVPADDPRFTVVVSTPRIAGKKRVWKVGVTLCTNEDFAATPALPDSSTRTLPAALAFSVAGALAVRTAVPENVPPPRDETRALATSEPTCPKPKNFNTDGHIALPRRRGHADRFRSRRSSVYEEEIRYSPADRTSASCDGVPAEDVNVALPLVALLEDLLKLRQRRRLGRSYCPAESRHSPQHKSPRASSLLNHPPIESAARSRVPLASTKLERQARQERAPSFELRKYCGLRNVAH